MKRPSVLLMNRVYPPSRGPTGRLARDLAKAFVRDGWQVSVITTGPKALKEHDGPIRVIRIKGPQKPRFRSYPLIVIKMLYAALRAPKADLVITMTDPPMTVPSGSILAKFKKSRHIHWCQDLYPDIFPALSIKIPKTLYKALSKLSFRALNKADKIVVIGRCMARRLSEQGLDAHKISVIPNWYNHELTNNTALKKAPSNSGAINKNSRSYKDLKKDAPKFRVMYSGNIGRAHPMQSILSAAKSLNTTHPEIEFVFVGEGPNFNKIVKFRSEHSLDNIRLIPYQPINRLKNVLESGDLHLITMQEEALGYLVPSKLYSALAVERPCIFIGPDHCEAANVIKDYKAGSVLAPYNTKGLIESIIKYRMDGDVWFAAHEGAKKAGAVFIPKQSIAAWIERARTILNLPQAQATNASPESQNVNNADMDKAA